jgi:3-oxoacyl-[acyl-carrier-protein] synthase II
VQFAVAAAQEAVDQAQIGGVNGERVGVVWGTGAGGLPYVDSILGERFDRAWTACEPLSLFKTIPDAAATALAMRFGARGPVSTVTAACVSSTLAIVQAVRLIRDGHADVVICGGSEAWLTPMGIGSFSLLRALSTAYNDTPERASRPFDAGRDGFVPAEGAGALVLEAAEHARARGAAPIAMISGCGVTNDAHHLSAPLADGSQAARTITLALDDAGIAPQDVGYVNAHGTSTKLNDIAETVALKRALGAHAYRAPVSATKSMTGHGLGASGAWETIVTALSLRGQVVHPTINLETPDPECDLDYVPEGARRVEMEHALKVSFGFGGQNVAVVVSRG